MTYRCPSCKRVLNEQYLFGGGFSLHCGRGPCKSTAANEGAEGDEKISHGAFRLWHLLRDMTGANACCWPSVDTISKLIHCGKDSVLGWIVELEASGYLRIERGHRHKSNRYFVGGRKQDHGGSKQGIIGGRKQGMESIPQIESNPVGCVSGERTDLGKKEPNSDPAVAAEFFRKMREEIR